MLALSSIDLSFELTNRDCQVAVIKHKQHAVGEGLSNVMEALQC